MDIDMQIAEAKKQLMDAEIDLLNMKQKLVYDEGKIKSQKHIIIGINASIHALETLKILPIIKHLDYGTSQK